MDEEHWPNISKSTLFYFTFLKDIVSVVIIYLNSFLLKKKTLKIGFASQNK